MARQKYTTFWNDLPRADTNECIEFPGSRNRFGYGYFAIPGTKNRTTGAHRRAYELCIGPIPEGLFVCHTCDNPPCCNPKHLFLGTALDNTRDMLSKGRRRPPIGERNAGSKLTEKEVIEIRKLHRPGVHYSTLAKTFGVSISAIHRIVKRKSWKHI